MNTRFRAASVATAVIAAIGIATAASASSGSDSSDAPKPRPRAIKAPVAQAGTPVFGTAVPVAPNGGHGYATVTCPGGTAPTGGGGSTSGYDIFFTDSFASGSDWVIRGTNTGSTEQNLTAFAVCQ
ncbi:hypothetical protein [Streptomyces sp. NPDC059063]|uniref:hypothetical protein n=1 Tax=unclassified Streptomyces TaxID=2593676 RepID=UPI0036D147C0